MRLVMIPLLAMLILSVSGPAQAVATRDLRVDGKQPAEYVAAQTGKSWAVVIGINDYRDSKVPRLKYAVADAKAVGAELERRGYQVTYLLNDAATGRAIRSELRTKLPRKAGKQDRVLVYYAGHGQDDKIQGRRTMGYLLPVDGELDDIPATGISMGVVKELADALPVKQALFLMDACYGGIAGQQTRSLPKMSDAYLKEITRNPGRQLITAGGADQEALEASDGGHGLFTSYLLKGLADGLADLNEDGIIPASELYAYLDSRVFADAQMKGHKQRPELWNLSPDKGEFVFFASRGLPGGGKAVATAPAGGAPSAALSQAEQELKALEEQERQAEEGRKLAALQQQIEEKKKRIELAKAPSYTTPQQAGREITGKDGAPMILVPAGEFQMGSENGDADEKPVHRVQLEAFYLDKYEVTTSLYGKFMQATGRKEPNYWPLTRQVSAGDRPVVGVDWNDADAYCRYYGKRLPTEAEWEKAARGTDGRSYPWGNAEPSSGLANFGKSYQNVSNVYERLIPVGSYGDGKSPYGVYDLAGNVWEWVADWYDDKYYQRGPVDNPKGPSMGESRVLRGGSWNVGPRLVPSANRNWNTPSSRYDTIGFRCAQDISQ